MKKFKYNLEKVMEVKEIVLKKAQRDLAFTEQEYRDAGDRLRDRQFFMEQYAREIYTGRCETVSELKLKTDYYYQLAEEIQEQKKALEQLELKIGELRRQLLQKQRDYKILSRLKEKQMAEYLADVQKEEQVFLDEIALTSGQRVSNSEQVNS